MTALIEVARIRDVIAAMPPDHDAWLSPSERERLGMLRVAPRREQYLAGHWLARCVLATRAGGDARDWSLQQRPGKPPAVSASDRSLQLSLSHSGEWIAAAASERAIGIDIEQRRVRDALHRFEDLLLADGDVAGALDNDALLCRWVVKEALIKREHGAALPEQLAALRIARCATDAAEVQLLTTDHYQLGIAIAAGATFELRSAANVIERGGWQSRSGS